MRTLIISFFLTIAAFAAQAQTYPVYSETLVNDFADLLPDAAEARIRQQLDALKSDTGVEMTVVTLDDQATYAPGEGFEEFATNLFNKWGIGDKNKNDGIMVLVIRNDRVMRIELGSGYSRDWDKVAKRTIDTFFLPQFKNDNYAAGIENGVTATIADIARPHAAGDAPASGGGIAVGWIIAGLGALAALFVGGKRFAKSRRRCPSCDARGTLQNHRETLTEATRKSEGKAQETTTCSNCSYRNSAVIPLAMLSDNASSGSSFGGGSSSGGGSSGSW